ncbi:FG-GAP repeat protein [Polystyrenella longa]|uniref:FG-GAP repeat protein n=1 Tax=Polystyrenella longa TaxID=2528007 RepID=A0A518CKE1_9PLAN|nr:VCBS repeat-containing protein [Polystyrenella longa]QDU79687.1 FG-GAP repeat protein [Polystyrenella longa]
MRSHSIQTPLIPLLLGLLFLAGASRISTAAEPVEPKWTGRGAYRLLLEVPADSNLTDRKQDERVVACPVDFKTWLIDQDVNGTVDLSTLQLHRFDPQTGEPIKGSEYAAAKTPWDQPCRFEDDEFSDGYTSRVGRPSETEDGRTRQFQRPRKARLFNREMSAEQGRLIWSHVAEQNKPAAYALYFDIKQEQDMKSVSPAPWIGDADPLRRETEEALGGFAHFPATVADLNADGLEDLISGTEKGDLIWYPNRGTRERPHFQGCQILTDETGPIDTGWYAAPFVYDWNNDGLLDLLVGSSGNVILWWQNVGSQKKHDFQYRGFVQNEEDRLRVPETPVAEDGANIFKHDYYNQPWVGDLDGDGLPEIVTGGYTTGRIFQYQGVGRNADGTPKLKYAGELGTDKGPIDTVWAAAPWMWDANADGQFDLLTGGWYWSGIEAPAPPGVADYLRFYQHAGKEPLLFERLPFPKTDSFPRGVITRPVLFYANSDPMPDLLVSDNSGEVHIIPNIGKAGEPRWDMPGERLTAPWGFDSDWDATGFASSNTGSESGEVLIGTYLWKREGSARSPEKKLIGAPRVNGKPISHPGPGYGDGYLYTQLYDWNNDGHNDILWGTQQGNIYVHLHSGTGDPLEFEPGQLVELATGESLKVGPPVVDSVEEATDFTILQGSRIVFALSDFNQDGIDDLLIAETFAQLWLFPGQAPSENAEAAARTFGPGQLLTTLKTRINQICCFDWNKDSFPDLLLGGTATEPVIVYLNQTQAGDPALSEAQAVEGLPYLFWGPRVAATDWNGDGDDDLMVQSEFFSFWIERSFLDHGYFAAQVSGKAGEYLQHRPNP